MTAYPCQSGDPEDWFAKPGTERALRAKRACFQSCPIVNECAEYAITVGIPYGIWGAMDEQERERIWKSKGEKPTQFMDELDAALIGVTLSKESAA